MTSEQDSYLTGFAWSYGYHYSLSPHYIRFALALAGNEAGAVRRYCELAYGNGVSLLIHAAANPHIAFAGTDFNPRHAAFARELANAGIPNLALSDEDIGTFLASHAGPPFDIVAMTGTWSWLPDGQRRTIIDQLPQVLAAAGVFCHDHMVLPGQFAESALRQLLMVLTGDRTPAGAGDLPDIAVSISRALAFVDSNPAFLSLYPAARTRLEELSEQPPEEVAHEYFNHHWNPSYFASTARIMAAAGLSWAGPWKLLEHFDSLHLTRRQQAFLKPLADVPSREMARDYARLKGMRYDLWQRPVCEPSTRAIDRLLDETRLVMVRLPDEGDVQAIGTLGTFHLSRPQRDAALALLADGRPVSARAVLGPPGEDALLPLVAMIECGLVQFASPDHAAAVPACVRLNKALRALAGTPQQVGYLASPVTGAGVPVRRSDQAFLDARDAGCATQEQLLSHALENWRGAAPVAESLRHEAEDFLRRRLPLYRALGITG